MDPWKLSRLWLCVGVMLALLAAGGYARLVWGVPEAPYGWGNIPYSKDPFPEPRGYDPFVRLEEQVLQAELERWLRTPQPPRMVSGLRLEGPGDP